MKRSALLFGALMLGVASGANAQALSMQMSNGWTFGFAGNVNIFAMYQSQSDDGEISDFVDTDGDGVPDAGNTPGALVGIGGKGLYYGTGLLPAFATFTAKGKEGNTDLGVQFGFAPQVQCGGNAHDCFGAQIDMRQVFLTVGGTWGTITAGKEIGIYQRSNILSDQTLFGVGGGGIAPGGTTLGRIGFGYIYTNFVPQFSYSSPAGRSTSINIGLMEPSAFGSYTELSIPRLEAEVSFKAGNNLSVFVGGTAQNGKDPGNDESKTAVGASGGLTYKSATFSLHGSGYFGKGLGTTLMFSPLSQVGDELTTSYGYYGQLTFTPANSKMTIAGSYGSSFLKDEDDNFKTENSLISAGVYYQATKSLKMVFEGDYQWSDNKELDLDKSSAFTGAFGLMLFY